MVPLKNWISPEITSLADYQNIPRTTKNNKIISIGWPELNALGTAYFIRAEILKKEGDLDGARREYQRILQECPDAYQQAYQGWFWKLSVLANDSLELMDTSYDYGDYQASTLVNKAWQYYLRNDLKGAQLLARQCLDLYDEKSLDYKKESALANFILGKIFLKKGLKKEAAVKFKKVLYEYPVIVYPNKKNYPYYNNITEQSKDFLDLMDTPYDFGNYSSETLTVKAWKSWDKKDYEGVELYAKKCIELWGERARQMQSQMPGYAKGSFIPFYWAVNDVGTCHFILGMVYQNQKKKDKAYQMYQTIIHDYEYAQCWDPKGHYWKVARVSELRLNQLNDKD